VPRLVHRRKRSSNWSGLPVIHLRPTYFLEWLLYPWQTAVPAEGAIFADARRQGSPFRPSLRTTRGRAIAALAEEPRRSHSAPRFRCPARSRWTTSKWPWSSPEALGRRIVFPRDLPISPSTSRSLKHMGVPSVHRPAPWMAPWLDYQKRSAWAGARQQRRESSPGRRSMTVGRVRPTARLDKLNGQQAWRAGRTPSKTQGKAHHEDSELCPRWSPAPTAESDACTSRNCSKAAAPQGSTVAGARYRVASPDLLKDGDPPPGGAPSGRDRSGSRSPPRRASLPDVTLLINNAGYRGRSTVPSRPSNTGPMRRRENGREFTSAPLSMTRAFRAGGSRKSGGAVVKHVGPCCPLVSLPMAATYFGPSKAAGLSLTRSIRAELRGQGTPSGPACWPCRPENGNGREAAGNRE